MARPASSPAPLPEPTDEQLALMYSHLARPGWPTTLEATLAHRIYGPCLRQAARATNLNRGAWRPAAAPPAPQVHAFIPPTPTAPAQPPKQRHRTGSPMHTTAIAYWPAARTAPPQWIDRKRAAANDTDD